VKEALNVIPVATILVLVYAVVGAEQVFAGHLEFAKYLEYMAIAAAGLAIGRGLDTHPKG